MQTCKSIKTLIKTLVLIVTFSPFAAAADVAVVVHPSSDVSSITLREAVDIFLGKTRQLRSGTTLIPLDQRHGREARDEFYRLAANKSAAQLKAYWARQVFTGQGEPPRSMIDDNEIKTLIAQNPNMIGYIDASFVDSTVKTVLLVK